MTSHLNSEGLRPGNRFIGIDPGLEIMGFAVLEASTDSPLLLEAGVVRSQGNELPDRLQNIHANLVDLFQQYQPQALAIEELYAHYAHPRTAILMGHARGVILLAGQQSHIPTFSYAATQIKKIITGHGRAPKEQMQHAIQREFALTHLPDPPDVADALAVALCHFYTHRPRWKDSLVG